MSSIKYPKDWEIQPFSRIADFINGAAFKPTDWKTEGLPIIRIQNLNNPETKFNYFNGKLDERYYVRNGDILLSWSASLGVYRWNRGNAILNQHIFNVKPKGGIDEDFLFYISHKAIDDLSRKVHGSTMKHFKKRELDEVMVPFPPLVEQRGIVEVLGTVDECIRLTDAVIERAEELKRGLMQQLLTRGIGHTEYKETPLGTIPKTWNLVKLGKVILDSQYGTSEKNNDEKMGYPTFRIPNVIGGKINLNDIKYVQIQPDEAEKYFLQKGDLLVVRTNANPDYIGRCASYNEELNPGIYASYLIRLKLNHENTNYDYVKYYLNSYQGRKQIRKIARTSAGNYNINVPNLKSVKINLPPKDEQNNIVSIIKQTEQNIDTEITKKNYYIKIKEGLMQILLSGKIRVELKGDGIHRIGDSREANN